MARFKIVLAVAISALLAAANGFADDNRGHSNLPLFDAHIHYKEPAWGLYPPDTVIEMMDRNGVAMALVSSTPDDGTIKLLEYAPKRIVPELRPYHGNAGSSNWTKAEGMETYIRGRLEKFPHEGIGEFHIHRLDPTDDELFTAIAAMAKERDILIHVHSGAEPVQYLFDLEPELTIIWAHAGMSEPPSVVGEMMSSYSTLYADTSYREDEILHSDKQLDPEWERVLLEFQDRFMIGSDTWVNGQWAIYDTLMDINRRWLGLLPREAAEKIAYRNAEQLFDRKISDELIGKR